MAGMGKRMRPHTLTTPKPLIPVAGKPIVHWLVEDIISVCSEKVDEIAFVTGDFGKETEGELLAIADKVGAKGTIHYQHEALGTAHAVLCAANALKGKIVVAFADTLFKANFKLNENKDSIIWVKKVDNPSSFGVVKLNDDGSVNDFIEKPKKFVSDQAIIGIYYFKDGEKLKNELQYLIDHNIKGNNEFQLTDALQNMKQKGVKFFTDTVSEWLDCGNKEATVNSNQRYLIFLQEKNLNLKAKSATLKNSMIIEPCFIDEDVKIINSVVGPYVSIGKATVIEKCIIENSIIQQNSVLKNVNITNTMVGNHANISNHALELNVGDFNTINF
jgi:glucose-1-phosphate thymidylyltransferase